MTATGTSVLAALPARVRDMDAIDLVPRASLLLLILNNREDLPLFVGAALLCLVAFRKRQLYASPWLWLGAALVMGVRQALRWEGMDDHVVVTTYWALALGLSLLTEQPERPMRESARLLLGLVFAFAAFWKLYSSEFVRSTFFHYTLLLDDRFRWFAVHLGGLTPAEYQANHAALARLQDPTSGLDRVTLVDTPRFFWLARAITWWGAGSETAAGLVFLVPLRGRLEAARHVMLFAFCATTYAVVPVGGFGVLLLTLGLALVPSGSRLRVVYAVALLATLVWASLWRALFYR